MSAKDNVTPNKCDNRAADLLVIGIDFGTTYSGVAYAFAHGKDPDIVSITSWPGCEGYPQPKIHTKISYKEDGTFTWGAMKHHDPPLVGMKLLLDEHQKLPVYAPASNLKLQLKRISKPIEEIATDYIKAVYEHAMSHIQSKVPKRYLETCQKRFILTVPAVWSDKAKATTLMAAKNAGIHPISLITEPEAAALYTLHGQKDYALKSGDAFVVCDAGGGTVDLISYEIKALSPRLELGELVESYGGMAGSLMLNKRFEQAVEDLVGTDVYFELKKKRGWSSAMETFDGHVKKAFRRDMSEDFLVGFPFAKLADDPQNNLEGSCWSMQWEDVEKIYAPVVKDILQLVGDQVNKIKLKRLSQEHSNKDEIKAIFLVGGFGESNYLKCCLEQKFPDIQIIQPHDAWSAIVRGAVLSELSQEAIVKNNISRHNLGVGLESRYHQVTDHGQRAKWDPVDGLFRVRKMHWHIKKGQELQRDVKIKISARQTLGARYTRDQLIFTQKLRVCYIDDPPVYPGPLITKYVTFTADLRSLPKEKLRKIRGVDGRIYYRVSFDLVFTTVSAGFRFSLEVDGAEWGSVEATFE